VDQRTSARPSQAGCRSPVQTPMRLAPGATGLGLWAVKAGAPSKLDSRSLPVDGGSAGASLGGFEGSRAMLMLGDPEDVERDHRDRARPGCSTFAAGARTGPL